MRELSAALIRRLLPGLAESAARLGGMRAWLESGSFYVDPGVTPDSVVLKNVSLSELVPYLSYDYERFAFSSLERRFTS